MFHFFCINSIVALCFLIEFVIELFSRYNNSNFYVIFKLKFLKINSLRDKYHEIASIIVSKAISIVLRISCEIEKYRIFSQIKLRIPT